VPAFGIVFSLGMERVYLTFPKAFIVFYSHSLVVYILLFGGLNVSGYVYKSKLFIVFYQLIFLEFLQAKY
jgi:hypothetical protein